MRCQKAKCRHLSPNKLAPHDASALIFPDLRTAVSRIEFEIQPAKSWHHDPVEFLLDFQPV